MHRRWLLWYTDPMHCRRLIRPALLALSLCISACASSQRLSANSVQALQMRHQGRVVELRHSCYYGDLYDDNDRWLLSPYPFAGTSHIVDLHGQPLHPLRQRGLLPAGSRFVVERLEFPSCWNLLSRMLVTPRFSPWVYLRLLDAPPPAADRPPPPFIWVLPDDLMDEMAAQEALEAALAPAGSMAPWLAQLRPTAQVAVRHKEMLLGMRQAELEAAMGPPQRHFADSLAGKRVQVAWYTTAEAWLLDGAIVAIKPARLADPTDGDVGDAKPAD